MIRIKICRYFDLRSIGILLLLTAGLAASYVEAQPVGAIRGKVVDSVTGEPLIGVNITANGTGTSTNTDGEFVLTSPLSGTITLKFSYLGYETSDIDLILVGDTIRSLEIPLKQTAIYFDPVEVNAGRFRQAQDDVRTSVIQIHPERARILPGAGEDVFRTLQAMPGVLTRSDFSSQLVIRGGGPDQNLIVMDDIEVFNPYRLYGLISMFNPETVSQINLVTGGFPVVYGDRLSAVLDVQNRDGATSAPVSGSVNTNITNANIVVEGETPFQSRGSWLFSARRTYYDLIAGPIARSAGWVQDDVAFPNFTDIQSRFAFGPFNGHRFIINTLHSRDAVNIISGEDRNTPDSVAVKDQTDHSVVGLAWHYTPNASFFSKFVVSHYRNRGDTDFEGRFLDPSLDRDDFIGPIVDSTGIRLFDFGISSLYDFEKTSLLQDIAFEMTRGYEIRAGAGVDFLTTRLIWTAELGQTLRDFLDSFDFPFVDRFTQERSYARLFGYVNNTFKVAGRLTVQPGLRFDRYEILNSTHVSPRISLSYGFDAHSTIRVGSGRFLQSPGYEKIFGQSQFFDLTDREAVNRLKPEEAVHYVAGIDRWIGSDVYIRLESYLKDFRNLISLKREPGTRYVVDPVQNGDRRYSHGWKEPYAVPIDSMTIIPENKASGNAQGIELFIEKRASRRDDRVSGWFSYAYAKAERNQYGFVIPFDFDQRHTLNIVMQYRLSESLELGARWRYGSGFPFTPPVGVRPRIALVDDDGDRIPVIRTDQYDRVIFNIDRGDYENRNSGRLPAYSRIDVRLNWYTRFWGVRWLFYLDVINITNRKNIIGYRYAIGNDLQVEPKASTMFPIIPTFGISFRF